MLLLQKYNILLIITLHLHVGGHWYVHFIVSMPLTLVDSIHVFMERYPLFPFFQNEELTEFYSMTLIIQIIIDLSKTVIYTNILF